MRLTLIILVLLAVGVPAVGTALVTDDPVFSKTVTLDFKGEALSDVARLLSNAAGVSIRASRDVEDQKVTILVDKMPLRDVMNGLATLFGWDWMVQTEDDHDIYIIYDPLKKKREADRQETLDKAWKALGEKMDSLARDAGSAKSFCRTLALRQYGQLSPEQREAYLSGMRICYNKESSTSDWWPSQAVMDEFANAGSRMEKPNVKVPEGWGAWEPDLGNPSNVAIELSSSVGANEIVAQSKVSISYFCQRESGDPQESFGFSMMEGDTAKGYLNLWTQEIDYPSETLENALPDKPKDELLSKKISISAAELVADGAFLKDGTGPCYATRTDLLAALHKKLGVQIISDYYSSWDALSGVRDITVKQLVEERLPGFTARWGWDGNVLYTRVKNVRTADSREIPNKLLRSWQAVVKRQGCRGLEELAQAAAFLSGEQKQAISENCYYLKLGECKEIDDIAGRESALLRFYGLLMPKQKREIFDGGVGVIGLTQEQRNALAALIYAANYTRVGIYNNDGLNMNEPQVVRGSTGDPVTRVEMNCSGSFIYMKSGEDLESRVVKLTVATTPEEALLMAKTHLGNDIDPQNVVATDDTIYTLAVRYEGYSGDEQVPEFYGATGRSAHSSYHRVKIKVPEKKD